MWGPLEWRPMRSHSKCSHVVKLMSNGNLPLSSIHLFVEVQGPNQSSTRFTSVLLWHSRESAVTAACEKRHAAEGIAPWVFENTSAESLGTWAKRGKQRSRSIVLSRYSHM